MIRGTLITESLRPGSTLDLTRIGTLTVREIRRFATHDVPAWQPGIWTVLEFDADDAAAESLAGEFADMLDQPGWYVNFSSAQETFVIYPGRVFRYPRGDAGGRAAAQAHGRALGVPEPQLDWTE
ncbi:MAG: hypothetical protein WAK82_07010 [Streptosporangiaceae bacterium]